MEALGLGYEDLKKVNPDIIMVSSSSQGWKGPHAHHPGWAIFMFALTGISALTGWPSQEPPYPWAIYPDVLPPRLAVTSVVAALRYRRRTGKGQHLRLSQLESCAYLLAPLCFDYQVNGRVAERSGNRCGWAAPHGVYRCRGEDRWCAITIMTDVQWKNFCEVIERPEWKDDPKFATLLGRKENEDILDHLIEEWTTRRTPEEAMALMQNASVPAGRLSNSQELHDDPQLNDRGHFMVSDHPYIGKHSIEAAAFKLSRTPSQLNTPGPDLGQHNEYIFCQMLGMPTEEFSELHAQGVFE
jgi:benzylsuccinate CoA-transferase BbsF subunit